MSAIKISKELHEQMKEYCQRNGYKMSGWAEKILKKELDLRTLKR